jgi:hypothetical protein
MYDDVYERLWEAGIDEPVWIYTDNNIVETQAYAYG